MKNSRIKALIQRLGIKSKKGGVLMYKGAPLKIKGMQVVLPNDNEPDKKGTIKLSPDSERDALAASPVHKMLCLIASNVLTKEYENYVRTSLNCGSMGGRSATTLPKWAKTTTLSKSGLASFMTQFRKNWGGVVLGPQPGKGVLVTSGAGLSVYDDWGKNLPIIEQMLQDEDFIVTEALVPGEVVPITNALISLLNNSVGKKDGSVIEPYTRKGMPVKGNTGASETNKSTPKKEVSPTPPPKVVDDQGPPWDTQQPSVEQPNVHPQAPVQSPQPMVADEPEVYTLADGTVVNSEGMMPQQQMAPIGMGMPMQQQMAPMQPMHPMGMGMQQQPMHPMQQQMAPMQQQMQPMGQMNMPMGGMNPGMLADPTINGWANGMM